MENKEINAQIVLKLGMVSFIPGNNFMCHCPYHEDHKPSAGVDLEKGLFNCFSCGRGKGMTLRGLYRDITGHSINKDLGIKWENTNDKEFINPFESQINKYKVTKVDYSKQPDVGIAITGLIVPVTDSQDVLKYLEKRKISLDVAKKMKMSFAVDAKSYSINDPTNKKLQVNFTNRLLIPIFEHGKLMSCEGRDIYGEEAYIKAMKLKGWPENKIIYKKCIYPTGASTSTLYDIDKLDKNQMIYFCEGLMDLSILREDSFFNKKNSTAIFGASISNRQMYLLKQYNFTDIIDNDLAGWRSLKKLYDELSKVPEIERKDWKFLIPPYHDLGVKDVGDLPVKANILVKDIRERKWLNSSKYILDNKDLIYSMVEKLTEEKIQKKNIVNNLNRRVMVHTRTPID